MFHKSAQEVFVVVFLSVPAFGQEWAAKMFSTTSHDFGIVAGARRPSTPSSWKTSMSRRYSAGVGKSCSCTKPEIQTPTLKTHEKGAILATYNTAAFLGAKGATLTVTFDRPFFAEVQLQVRGYIRGDVAISPGIVDFGEVDENSNREKAIMVDYAGGDDWQIVAVQSTNSHISGTAAEVSRGGGQVTYRVAVHLDRRAPSGYLADHVILLTNDPRNTDVVVPIEGVVRAQVA